jgi:flagellar protein FlaG
MEVRMRNVEDMNPKLNGWHGVGARGKSPPAVPATQADGTGNVVGQTSVNLEDAEKVAGEIERILDGLNKSIHFEVSNETNDVVIQVVDRRTGKIIRQIPPDELLNLRRRFQEVCGVLFDQIV